MNRKRTPRLGTAAPLEIDHAATLIVARATTSPKNASSRDVVIIVAPADRRDRFSASLDGGVLVKSSRTPFLDAARALLRKGRDPSTTIVMRHRGSHVDALRARLGAAARLTVREEDGRPPRFARWKPLHLGDGSARRAEDGAAATSLAEAAE